MVFISAGELDSALSADQGIRCVSLTALGAKSLLWSATICRYCIFDRVNFQAVFDTSSGSNRYKLYWLMVAQDRRRARQDDFAPARLADNTGELLPRLWREGPRVR